MEEVSVIIPVYNRSRLITRCLQSIYDQSYRPIRLIVVDNASTDGSDRAVREWSESHSSDDFSVEILSEPVHGACAARNTGLRHASTDWIFFFDSDDVMLPDCIATAMHCARLYPELDLIYWRRAIISSSGKPQAKCFSRKNLMRRHLLNTLLSTQSFCVRREFFIKVGGWNEDLPVWNDYELGYRILAASPRAKGIDRVLANIYPQEESITGTSVSAKSGKWELSLDAIQRHAENREVGLSAKLRTQILNLINYRRMNLAALYAAEGRHDLALPLLQKALAGVSLPRRPLLRLLYTYTRLGGRAAYLLWPR